MPRYDRRVIFTPQVLCILALDGFTVFYGWAKVILVCVRLALEGRVNVLCMLQNI